MEDPCTAQREGGREGAGRQGEAAQDSSGGRAWRGAEGRGKGAWIQRRGGGEQGEHSSGSRTDPNTNSDEAPHPSPCPQIQNTAREGPAS